MCASNIKNVISCHTHPPMGVPVLWQDGSVEHISHFLVSNVQSKFYRLDLLLLLPVFFFNQITKLLLNTVTFVLSLGTNYVPNKIVVCCSFFWKIDLLLLLVRWCTNDAMACSPISFREVDWVFCSTIALWLSYQQNRHSNGPESRRTSKRMWRLKCCLSVCCLCCLWRSTLW